ncbi:Adenosine monophosphate-protein transferase VbhT [Streptomyces hundungensis]|uniref:protein adenylyltransferase n=1 Tax=Streptomyces hundungensis TaxID=1077946 RepID=A0A387HKI7_9ACTN|nr:Fic family protein [Streptomyces hundungensis]AYG82773.1 Adenosine monophosphate-protein transferase VbhT [Streptomyces hundungensis]
MIDPYLHPSGVLRNRLGLTDPDLLAQAEADITHAELVRLGERPLAGAYDLGHLRAFHVAIFGAVYPWAGELRVVEISKRTPFCPSATLVSFGEEVFGRLASAGHLRGLGRAEFADALAELYGDLNALHPFREGNGRTQRAFCAQLASDAGYELDWAGMDPAENEYASIKSYLGDNGPLSRMLAALLGP